MRAILAGIAILALAAAPADAAAPIEGLWTNPSGSVVIAIAPCGVAWCGTVKWASDKAKQDAAKGTDRLVGAELLSSLRRTDDSRWTGRLFVPDQKLRVKAKLQLLGDRQLRVSGCALGKSLCKSQLWTRTDKPLPASD